MECVRAASFPATDMIRSRFTILLIPIAPLETLARSVSNADQIVIARRVQEFTAYASASEIGRYFSGWFALLRHFSIQLYTSLG